jgi:hypothetical protein
MPKLLIFAVVSGEAPTNSQGNKLYSRRKRAEGKSRRSLLAYYGIFCVEGKK